MEKPLGSGTFVSSQLQDTTLPSVSLALQLSLSVTVTPWYTVNGDLLLGRAYGAWRTVTEILFVAVSLSLSVTLNSNV